MSSPRPADFPPLSSLHSDDDHLPAPTMSTEYDTCVRCHRANDDPYYKSCLSCRIKMRESRMRSRNLKNLGRVEALTDVKSSSSAPGQQLIIPSTSTIAAVFGKRNLAQNIPSTMDHERKYSKLGPDYKSKATIIDVRFTRQVFCLHGI